jgi:drug/metabolite transporter (DMT)-like permease
LVVVAGIAMAVFASLLFNAGIVLQALEARREPPELGLRLALLSALLRRWRWLLGLALGVVGVVPQIIALELAPFVVVQPALTVGLLLVLAIAVRTFDEHPGPREWLAVGSIIAGVALVAVGVPPHTEQHRGGPLVITVVLGLSGCSLVPFLTRNHGGGSGVVTMVASGVGFAATNIATKLVSDDLGLGHYWNAAGWATIVILDGCAATVTGMTAFQRARATVVAPVTTALQAFLPIVLEPLFLGEQWSQAALAGFPLATGVVIAAAGTINLARAPGVGHMVATASRPGDAAASR